MSNPIFVEFAPNLNSPFVRLSREETIQLRSQFIPNACKLHFPNTPMKVIRANGQYLYDDDGNEVLDCVNCVAHVGHCNPAVVDSAKTAMLQMGNISVGLNAIVTEYVAKLKATFPPEIDTFLFVTSASEANDLAIQMARMYTGAYDVVSVERSFHGGVILANCVSPRQFNELERCPDWVHVVECPDLYRGKYTDSDPSAVEKYCNNARDTMQSAVENNRKLACFISEPIMTLAGVILPPTEWMHSVYKDIRSFGGLVIGDEAQSGLGRNGDTMWCFQLYDDLVPDIITIGKPLGNGHPMACIATRSSIAATLLRDTQNELHYACDVVSAAVGLAVLNTIEIHSLQMNAKNVGDFLREGIRALANTHHNIGDVRGKGFMIGVEIIYNQLSRKPAPEIAERICYKMLKNFTIVANDGPFKNILIFTPPMCFTMENAHCAIVRLDTVLKEIEDTPFGFDVPLDGPSTSSSSITGQRLLSLEEFINVTGHGQSETASEGSGDGEGAAQPTSLQGSFTEDFEDADLSAASNSFASMD